jgi:hypothetical protein
LHPRTADPHSAPVHRPLHQTIATLTLTALAVLACQSPDGAGDPFLTGPHAIGYISLGVTSASAAFLPNTSTVAPNSCWTETVGTCTVQVEPECDATCADGENCTFDAACQPTCEKACSMGCALEEECYLDELGQAGCRVRETVDAGTVEISGAREAIVLTSARPSYSSSSQSPLIDPGAALKTVASGSLNAGLGPFEVTVVAPPTLRLITDALPT